MRYPILNMTKILNKLHNNEFLLFLFLGFFSFANGLFSNYRSLWLQSNNLTTSNIANITSIASIITVLIFIMFTIGISIPKQKKAINFILLLKIFTSISLFFLNNSTHIKLIKFITFFDIAFIELILASIYPLLLNISKNDLTYTRKETIESFFTKIGFLIASLTLGLSLGKLILNYNTCLFLSTIFFLISFLIFANIKINFNNQNSYITIKPTLNYLNTHKFLYLYLLCNALSSLIWASILGMPLLSLTNNLGFSPKSASFIVLIFGILTNFLAIIIVKHLKVKNDNVNMFFKYGMRLIFYLLVFISNNKLLLIITFMYLLLFDIPYGFLFGSYFINKVPNKYTFVITTLKYCSSLIGNSLGIFICGLVFNLNIKYLVLPALIIGIIHYILGTYLLNKREEFKY